MKDDLLELLMEAYMMGWRDCLAGDDVRSLDYQSKDQITERIAEAFLKSRKKEEN